MEMQMNSVREVYSQQVKEHGSTHESFRVLGGPRCVMSAQLLLICLLCQCGGAVSMPQV